MIHPLDPIQSASSLKSANLPCVEDRSIGVSATLIAVGAGFLIGGAYFLVRPDDAADVMASSIAPLAMSFVFFRNRQ